MRIYLIFLTSHCQLFALIINRPGVAGVVFCFASIISPGKSLVTDSSVPGRVLGHHLFYEKVGAEPYIVQTVKEGYR